MSIPQIVTTKLVLYDENASAEAGLYYDNGFVNVEKDMLGITQYTNLASIPTSVYPVAGLVKTAVDDLQVQIDNLTSNISITNPSTNLYILSGQVMSNNINMLKIIFY